MVHYAPVGMVVTLVDSAGREVFGIPDPAGGFFDAAGDFDRLIGQPGRWRAWDQIQEFGETTVTSDVAARLVLDLRELMAAADDGRERRGLERLSVLAEDCAADAGALLVFHGD